jgi:small-conductance mechanosensitive channel
MLERIAITGDPVWDTAITALVAAVAALLIHLAVVSAIHRVIQHHPVAIAGLRRSREPTRWIAVFAALEAVLLAAPRALPYRGDLRHAVGVALILCFTWLAVASVTALADVVTLLNPSRAGDDLHARRLQTQADVFSRVLNALIVVIGLSLALVTFPEVRRVGATLLASAGVVGIVAGLAAQPVLGNAFAGLQIAFTQPIRIGDEVVIKDEFGKVEEITTSFVVVALWDERRMVLPIKWFIENPFQNWTRRTAQIMGTVELWTDFGMPLEPLRAELERLCKTDPAWDGRVATVAVTDSNERAMKVRLLVSSPSSGENSDLRMRLREAVLAFLHREYREYLPRLHARVDERAANDETGSSGQRRLASR